MKEDLKENGYLAYVTGRNGEMYNVVIQTSLHISPEVLQSTLKGRELFSAHGISVCSYVNENITWYFQGTFIELSPLFYQRRNILSLGENPQEKILRWYPPPGWTFVEIVERLNGMTLPGMINAHAPGMTAVVEGVESLPLTRPLILGYV